MVVDRSIDKGMGRKIYQNVNSGNLWVLGFWVIVILLFYSLYIFCLYNAHALLWISDTILSKTKERKCTALVQVLP